MIFSESFLHFFPLFLIQNHLKRTEFLWFSFHKNNVRIIFYQYFPRYQPWQQKYCYIPLRKTEIALSFSQILQTNYLIINIKNIHTLPGGCKDLSVLKHSFVSISNIIFIDFPQITRIFNIGNIK